ncbi:MAG TPA: hypothetical protein VIS05_12145 [Ilumatobacter sp.]
MGERALRPFWVHQLAEYLIGVSLVAQGMQDPSPLVPTVAGGLVLVNAAMVRGPLGAFKLVGRALHRWLDVVVMAVIAAGALQPWIAVDVSGRFIMGVILVPLGFLWFYTDWAERPQRKQRRVDRAGSTGEVVGRSAGRIAASAFLAGKQAVKKRSR